MSPTKQTAIPALAGPRASAFEAHASNVRTRTEVALRGALARSMEERQALGADACAVLAAIGSLATRGGKRLRPVLCAAAFEGFGGGPFASIEGALVALELLQVYFLIHDDWMDQDPVRRGGPSVHVMLRGHWGSDDLGDAAAVLAGDLACATAQEALATALAGPAERAEAARVFGRMQSDVILGQLLDMRSASQTLGDVERMHALKTGSYTVDGPLALGAALAGASQEASAKLRAFAAPLGIAFQLRDDLLGTFGDTRETGKALHGDLRQGKRTSLVVELARRSSDAPDVRELTARTLGNPAASSADLASLAECMERVGARAAVESRLDALLGEALARLAEVPIRTDMRDVLEGAAMAMGARAR